MTNADRFEEDLRDLLVRRDPGPVPASLELKVVGRLRSASARPPVLIGAWAGRLGAGLAAAAVVLVVVLAQPHGFASDVAATPSSSLAVTAPGPGEGIADNPMAPWIQFGIAALVFLALLRLAFRAERRAVSLAAFAAAIAIIWVGSMVARPDALAVGSGVSGVSPPVDSAPAGDDHADVAAEGDVTFYILFAVTNTTALPVRLHGLVAPPIFASGSPSELDYPRLLGLRWWPDGENCCLPEQAVPFTPTTLAAGASVDLVAVGKAGACATSQAPSGGYATIDEVPLVYEQLTIFYTAAIQLDQEVRIPTRTGCSAGVEPTPRASDLRNPEASAP